MGDINADLFKNKIVVFVTFIGISLIIFSSSTGRVFLSDDYCTLTHLAASGNILMKSFFRPIGDLTLKWNYMLTGWDPFYFYLTNILLHAINSFLLYVFCRTWFAGDSRSILFSTIAGLIFLTYPSHSEAILWTIGRGISLAVTFSLLAMICFVSRIRQALKYFLVCFFYFAALACYESVLLLPLVLASLSRRIGQQQKVIWTITLTCTLILHSFLRYYFTGGIWQAYQGIVFSKDVFAYISTLLKIILRLFIPPFNNQVLFTICGAIVLLLLSVLLYSNRSRIFKDRLFFNSLSLSTAGLFASIIVAVSYGLSTRTSEGDRLLYFPSCFYAMLIAGVIIGVIRSRRVAFMVCGIIVTIQVIFLLDNQENWKRASRYAVGILNTIATTPQRPLYIVNLPSDYKGAFVFRNCLGEALTHYNIDTSGIKIVNVLQGTDADNIRGKIHAVKRGGVISIWPGTTMKVNNGSVELIRNDSIMQGLVPVSSVLYWNKDSMVAAGQ